MRRRLRVAGKGLKDGKQAYTSQKQADGLQGLAYIGWMGD